MEGMTEVQGLRAIALLVILVYHARLGLLSNSGFVGYDILFVLAGYTMTSALHSGRNKVISIKKYLSERFYRTYPLYIFVLFGINLISMNGFSRFNQQENAIFSLLSFSSLANIPLLIKRSEPFVGHYAQPYSHTWFLSALIQVQLLWAASYYALSLFSSSRTTQVRTVRISMATLFILAELIKKKYPVGAFYDSWYRFAEFLCGVSAAWTKTDDKNLSNEVQKDNQKYSIMSGLVLATYFFTRLGSIKPGVTIVPLCLCTAYLAANSSGNIKNFLRNNVLQWVQERWLSVYLLHWPVLELLDYFKKFQSTRFHRGTSLLASIFFAHLLYDSVQKPILSYENRESGGDNKKLNRYLKYGSIIFFAQIIIMANGTFDGDADRIALEQKNLLKVKEWTERLSSHYQVDVKRGCRNALRDNNLDFFHECNQPSEDEIVLMGDSHAGDLWYDLNMTFPKATIVELVGEGCSLVDDENEDDHCWKLFTQFQNVLGDRKDRLRAVIIASTWENVNVNQLSMLESVVRFFTRYTDAKVIVLGPLPVFNPSPLSLITTKKVKSIDELELESQKLLRHDTESETILEDFVTPLGADFVPATDTLCEGENLSRDSSEFFCSPLSDDKTALMFVEDGHLNREGAKKLVKGIIPLLRFALKSNSNVV